MHWDVDLTDPSRLAFLLEGYLVLGVVPVEGKPPPVLAEGTLRIRFPGGRLHEGPARVIRASGPGAFLVQADGLPDEATLRTLSEGHAVPPPPPPPETGGNALRDTLDDMLATLDPRAQLVFPGALEAPPPPPRPAVRIERAPSAAPATPFAEPPEDGTQPSVSGRESEYSDVYAKVKDLPLLDKQRLARHGRRTVRQILMRDPNKTLQRLVLANPDVGLDEVQEYASWPGLCKEALEFITTHSTWMASRALALALVRNPSAPMDVAIRLVPRLGPSEWRMLVRPGTVRTPIATAARKALETARDA